MRSPAKYILPVAFAASLSCAPQTTTLRSDLHIWGHRGDLGISIRQGNDRWEQVAPEIWRYYPGDNYVVVSEKEEFKVPLWIVTKYSNPNERKAKVRLESGKTLDAAISLTDVVDDPIYGRHDNVILYPVIGNHNPGMVFVMYARVPSRYKASLSRFKDVRPNDIDYISIQVPEP